MVEPTERCSGDGLTRRERQIMEIIYAEGEATARTVMERMSDPPTYATVRTLLRVLMEKDILQHRKEGKTYIYTPVKSRTIEGKSALRRVVRSFFGGSLEQIMACLLDESQRSELNAEELEKVEQMIREAKGRSKGPQS